MIFLFGIYRPQGVSAARIQSSPQTRRSEWSHWEKTMKAWKKAGSGSQDYFKAMSVEAMVLFEESWLSHMSTLSVSRSIFVCEWFLGAASSFVPVKQMYLFSPVYGELILASLLWPLHSHQRTNDSLLFTDMASFCLFKCSFRLYFPEAFYSQSHVTHGLDGCISHYISMEWFSFIDALV